MHQLLQNTFLNGSPWAFRGILCFHHLKKHFDIISDFENVAEIVQRIQTF